ncbi:zinc ribbon domain-containing protein [Dehalococcoides mccartyi]|nr:zinc ribbon domain-containing protein [Dehalococcoides mccartyi]
MPIYEYYCEKCHKTTELMSDFSKDNEYILCPICRGNAAKVFSNFNWHHQTPNFVKFQESADEKMHYAEKRLSEDKSLDPVAWLEKVKTANLAEKAVKSG